MALGAVCCTSLVDRFEGLDGVFMFEAVNKDAEASSRLSSGIACNQFVFSYL